MRVLALDTALGATSAAIVDFPACQVLAHRSAAMERGHAEALMPMVETLIGEVPGGFSTLDRIVTTVGPGSFTGLRVAIAAARSFGLALRRPVVGVSTLTAYAAPLISAGSRTSIAAAVDARHGSVFFHAFWLDGRTSFGPALVSAEEAARRLAGNSAPPRLVGNGAEIVAAAARDLGIDTVVQAREAAPDIVWVARLGAAADPAFAPARPLYLRAASAVPQTGGRIARQG